MPDAQPDFARLDGRATTLMLDLRGPAPAVLHWGARLPEGTDPALLARLATRDPAPSAPDVEPAIALTPLAGAGFPGQPGLLAHREGLGWASWTAIESVEVGEGEVSVVSADTANGLRLTHRLALALDGDVLRGVTELCNTGETPLTVGHCAAPVLPIPAACTQLLTFEGRWAGEFQTLKLERGPGAFVRETRRGRTSHDAYPAVFLETPGADEAAGEAYALHLAWSGNHALRVETLLDGRAFASLGELVLPGELRLAPGETYRTPELVCAWSGEGRGGATRALHAHVRARPEHARLRAKPRPVHYNSWEAVYFDHDPAVLADLAQRAAALGVERFVLDDGWFKGRRHDRAGLGDWEVDRSVHPEGLAPLITHVRGLGLEFGLWVEPEMVNPDSDLFRAHPDWVLAAPPAPQLAFRHQFALDFGRAEVREHVWTWLDALLRAHDIAYLKWDMNRDLNHPGGADGRPGAHAHVQGLYAVLARLRADHPAVEVESCASGGGRADLGVLAFADRAWTSDSNDACDRQAIQRGLSHILPFELMGSHVGPAECHITGRRLSMALRVATALFGHMGVEADLRALDARETDELAAGIALHKAERALIHSGKLHRLDRPDGQIAFGVLAPDGGRALFSFALIAEPRTSVVGRLRLAGLDPAADYRVEVAWPAPPACVPALGPALSQGFTASGAVLMRLGFELPRMRPQSALIFRLTRVAG